MIAILSDIHGNLEALRAVMADARQQGATKFYCLGDVVGYGPQPRECLDIAMTFDLTILGNHDQGALFDPEGFSSIAQRAIFWTRDQLERAGSLAERERRWEFLADRPRTHRDEYGLFVHGSVRNPLNEYVFPEDIYNQRKIERIFSLVERLCFQGHTHVPGIFTVGETGERYHFYQPADLDNVYTVNGGKTLCNVGSVGQPRDGDRRASYVLFDGTTIRFRRVVYDIEATVRKIHAERELDRVLGDRLRDGR